mmetsp:Transcript_6986/g.11096  ORF Transcript_6986/g.11096 Transcript_6986/m.11096 type:complete len:301 (-) Transcript_6986:38-940(-)
MSGWGSGGWSSSSWSGSDAWGQGDSWGASSWGASGGAASDGAVQAAGLPASRSLQDHVSWSSGSNAISGTSATSSSTSGFPAQGEAVKAPEMSVSKVPSRQDRWWLGVDGETRRQYAEEMRDWLRSIDTNFTSYFQILEENYDTVDQIRRLYTVDRKRSGEPKYFDPLFFQDNHVTDPGHRRLFKKWFADEWGMAFAEDQAGKEDASSEAATAGAEQEAATARGAQEAAAAKDAQEVAAARAAEHSAVDKSAGDAFAPIHRGEDTDADTRQSNWEAGTWSQDSWRGGGWGTGWAAGSRWT